MYVKRLKRCDFTGLRSCVAKIISFYSDVGKICVSTTFVDNWMNYIVVKFESCWIYEYSGI